MTNLLKKTRKQTDTEKAAHDELEKWSPTQQVQQNLSDMTSLMREAVSSFNNLRTQLSDCCQLIRYQDEASLRYSVMAKTVAKGDYGLVLNEEPIKMETQTVEEASLFTKLVASITSDKHADRRLTSCVQANKMIFEAIERWKSKGDKMRTLSAASGSTVSEMDTVAKKIAQFEEAIQILKARQKTITDLFYETRKKMQAFIESKNNEFYQYTTDKE